MEERAPDTWADSEEDKGGWEAKAKQFSRAKLKLYAFQAVVSLIFPFVFWYLGWSGGLESGLTSTGMPSWAVVLAFLIVYELITSAIFLPFSYYSGFTLQHRFGLSRQTTSAWLSDWVKSTGIGTVFFLAGMGAFYLSISLLPDSWWWIYAAGLSLVALALTFVAPVLLLPIFYKCTPLEDQGLVARIESLAERAGAHISKVCAIDMSRRTVAANAALTGIGATRQVLLGDTLLQQFEPDEVETVVAHELGHHLHGDIWKGLAAEVGSIWVGLFLLQWAVRPVFLALGLGDVSLVSNLPLLVLLGEVASMAAMPAVNALSRRYESEADSFAVGLSGKPRAYSSALYRLAKQNLSELWPPRWVELLLYTHPAIGRRMQATEAARPTRT